MSSSSPPRQRILDKAMDLFYRQGYNATGINQIISEAGVARASFYDHFESKEDLLVAYAMEMSRRDIAEIRAEVLAKPTAQSRFFAPLELLIPWLEATDFRGCPFQNLMADTPPDSSRVREVARQHSESLRTFFRELTLDLKNSEKKFSRLSPEKTATTFLLVFEGAIALCVAYRESWPVEHARVTLGHFLESPESR
ncbi:MAG: TetR/AcrR family transcriptional regulator [Terrimicrobiaceae bacterium]